MANGSLSSKVGGEGEIRRKLIEADLVDCIVALPDRLFFNTGISVSLWFISKNRQGNAHRERRGEVLFIDARMLGTMLSRRLRELTEDDILRIADTYHSWRNPDGGYQDLPGFSKAANHEDIKVHDFVLAPGRYVGAETLEEDEEPIEDKIDRITDLLFAEFERGQELEEILRERLKGLRR